MEYVAHRDLTFISTSGRSVEFKKGEPTYAPPQMHAELVANGIMPTEEIPEPAKGDGPQEPTAATEREAALFAAYEKMSLANKRESFTASGMPQLAPLSKELGWAVDAKERDVTWMKFSQDKAV
jgi:hypothetical protein